MSSKVILKTHQLAIGYPKFTVAADIDVALYEGELVCLIGPNGAGKSTLLRTIAGIQTPITGHTTLLGDDVHKLEARELARRLSIVLTDRIDVGLLSGYALVALGRHPYTDWTGQLSKQDEAIIRWAVEAVGAEEIAPRNVNELSDGERQKLMIARALAQEPAVMLLDEPTAYLDLPRRVEIMLLLRDLARKTSRAILLSTHDLDLALRNADRIWLMPKDGVLQVGAPEDLVLSGAFESAFSSEGVLFDRRAGSFRTQVEATKTIVVEGEGVRKIWTIRALERIGYALDDKALCRVIVTESTWILHHGDSSSNYDALHRLVMALSEI
ncbi:MAG: ABC transporter ATP-binding protein [Anaerolineae bacterium]|nr:ABC transporter ATP-binding protein [Anaerolineae bacterium]MDQ7033965.1 ABC transporter ATP-binding protein [Anaerolineae bacterium]